MSKKKTPLITWLIANRDRLEKLIEPEEADVRTTVDLLAEKWITLHEDQKKLVTEFNHLLAVEIGVRQHHDKILSSDINSLGRMVHDLDNKLNCDSNLHSATESKLKQQLCKHKFRVVHSSVEPKGLYDRDGYKYSIRSNCIKCGLSRRKQVGWLYRFVTTCLGNHLWLDETPGNTIANTKDGTCL